MGSINQDTQNKPNSCKYCRSTQIIKYGIDKGTQMYYCRECHHKFARMDTLPQMHTRTADIAEALSLCYAGMSLNDIRRHFIDQDNNYFSKATIYNWINRFSEDAIKATNLLQPQVSDCWLLKEIYIGIDPGKVNLQDAYLRSRSARKVSLWLVLDIVSRYLLSFQLNWGSSTPAIKVLLEMASKQAGKQPTALVIDKGATFIETNIAAGAQIEESRLVFQYDADLMSTFNDIIGERTRFICALKNRSTLEKFMPGWLVQYNYFNSQVRLGNKTPAQRASIKIPYIDWKGLIEGLSAIKTAKESATR